MIDDTDGGCCHDGRVDWKRLVLLAAVGLRSAPAAAEPSPLDPPAAAGAMAPGLAARDGVVVLSWIEPAGSPGEARVHRLRFSRWEGAAWSPAQTAAEGPGWFVNWADVPSVVPSGDGSLLAHWLVKVAGGPYAYDVAVARSTDGGGEWTSLGAPHRDGKAAEHGFVSILAEPGGARLIWLDGRATVDAADHSGGGSTALMATSVGAALGPEEALDPRVCDCCGTSAVLTADGPAFLYRDRSGAEVRDISIIRRAGGSWTSPAAVHRDGWVMPGCPVNGPAAAASGRRLAVAWFSGAGGAPRVLVASSADAGATFGAPAEVEGARAVGRVDLVLHDGGDAIVSWVAQVDAGDDPKSELRVRRVSPHGRMGPPVVIARTSADRAAGFPRMARRGADLIFAWTEPGEPSRLRAATLPVAAVPAPLPPAADPRPPPPSPPPPAVASVADFRAADLEGRPVALSSLRGSVVLINLWATWCEPCRDELPLLVDLHERWSPRGLVVVGVGLDKELGPVRSMVRREGLSYRIWHDSKGAAPARLGATSMPASYLLGRDGKVVWTKDGPLERDEPALLEALRSRLGAVEL